MFFFLFPAVALIGAAVQLFVQKHPRTSERVLDVVLRWWLAVSVGVVGVFAWSGHIFRAEEVAESIGFPPNNPFQWEVGFANLAIGAIGLICARRRDFWWPTAIASGIFLLGAAWGHIYEMVEHDNHAENNSGPVLWLDIAVPLITFALLIAYDRVRTAEVRRGAFVPSAAGD